MLNSPRIADNTEADPGAPATNEPAGEHEETLETAPAPSPASGLERVETLCDLGRFGDAVPVAGQLIADDPRNVAAWCLMARAQLGNDRATAALSAAHAARSLDPGNDLPHRLASLALSQLGREEEAALAAREATRCAPSAWEGHARLAHCLSAFRDRLKEAQSAADRALFLMPDAPGPHLAAGAVAIADGRRGDAAAAFCAALAVDPQCGDAHNQLADLQSRGRDRKGGGRRLRLSLPSLPRRGRSDGPSSA